MSGAHAVVDGRREHAGRRLAIDIERTDAAPAIARSAAAGFCEHLAAGRCGDLLLLVSELVTNSLVHVAAGRGVPIALSIDVREDRIRVEVRDGGAGFARPDRRGRPADGFGLFLLDRLCSRWGTGSPGSGCVWFELSP